MNSDQFFKFLDKKPGPNRDTIYALHRFAMHMRASLPAEHRGVVSEVETKFCDMLRDEMREPYPIKRMHSIYGNREIEVVRLNGGGNA